jgi:uncharacterized membrane protein YhhN
MAAFVLTLVPFLCATALALWQLLAFAAAPPSALKSAVKTAAVAALALGLWGAGAEGTDRLVLAGLLLGAAGDFFLSRPGQAAFLAGMAAFGLGHLAYAAAFVPLGAGWPDPWAAAAVALVGLCAWVFLAPRAGALAAPVRGYIVVILLMALAALRLHGMPLTLAGALLFVASDLLLALQLFVLPAGRVQAWAAHGVWALYWPAQALIALATL